MILQITKLRAGHNFAARSCCDLDFKVATQMLRVHIVHILPIHVPSSMRLALVVFKLSKDPDFKRADGLTD